MLDPDRKPRDDNGSITANIVIAVLLTVFAIPVLFVATCMPAAFVMMAVPNPALVIGGILMLAIALCVALAIHAGMPGKRIGFIAAAIEIALFGAWLFFFNPKLW